MSVLHYNEDGSESALSPLSDVVSVNLKQSVEGKRDIVEVRLRNPLTSNSNGNYYHQHVDPGSGLIRFDEGQTVKIYAAYVDTNRVIDTSDTSEDLLMTADIMEIKGDVSEGASPITLTCTSKMNVMLSRLWSQNYDVSTAKTSPTMIQNVIQNVTGDHTDAFGYDVNGDWVANGAYQVDARLDTSTNTAGESGFIETVRPYSGSDTGTVFPVTTLAKTFKPVYSWIGELSNIEHTNSASEIAAGGTKGARRMYRFYIDENNKFHWFYPKDTQLTILDGALTAAATTITVNDASSFDTKGRIRIDSEEIDYTGTSSTTFTGCTRGANNTTAATHVDGTSVASSIQLIEGDIGTGNKILNMKMTKKTFDMVNMVIFNAGVDLTGAGILSYHYEPGVSSKLQMTYKPYTDISERWIRDEILDKNSSSYTKDNTNGTLLFQERRYTPSYNITPHWSSTAVSNDSDLNDSLRQKAIDDGKARARNLILGRGSPRWKGTVEVKGRRYTPGDTASLTSYSLGINSTDVRITNVAHNLGRDGWFTTLNLEEDEAEQN